MATKKKAAKKKAATASGLSSALVFRKEWIFDPPPPFLRLDKAARTKINQLKADFVKSINQVIKGG